MNYEMEKIKMNKSIRLPYGQSKFKSLIEDGYHYIDRTKYIEIIENLEEKFLIFIRPRRFGKSLFVSVLDCYYNINYKDDFEKLFGKYYIGQNTTTKKNSYLILKLNFSGIDTKTYQSTYNDFLEAVKISVDEFISDYNNILKISKKEIDETLSKKSPTATLRKFISIVKKSTKRKVYVLIDEYDHFANELLSFNYDMFKKVTMENGFVRKFYEVLKIGIDSIIDRIFITGVTPITLDSFTSGFNMAMNVSTDIRLNEMLGFKKSETAELLKERIKDCPELDFNKIFLNMKNYYDGYLFNKNSIERMFNSDMVLYFLVKIYNCQLPEEMLDSNIMSDYTKIKNLFNIIDPVQNYKILQKLILNNELIGNIVPKFNLKKKFDSDDLISLLYYTGIITISGSEGAKIKFEIPNYVIKELYYEYFIKSIAEKENYDLDVSQIMDTVNDMAYRGNIKELIKYSQDFLMKISKRDLMNFDEKYIKIVMLAYLMLGKIYYVASEKETELGYADITCIGRDVYKVRHHWLIELKYLKTKYTDAEFETKKTEGLLQIAKYNLKENYVGELHRVVIIFTGVKCKYINVDGNELKDFELKS